MLGFLLIAPLLAGVASAGYDPYTDLTQLYRMQLLADAFDGYIPEDLQLDNNDVEIRSYWPEFAASLDDNAKAPSDMYGSQIYSGAHIRDQEHIEHSALHGYQSVAGGTAEGPANNKIQKSDKPLPAYCNPPNPCPVGKTAAKDNCVEDFENSAENNKQLLSEQDCPCDTEHMFSCPAGRETVSSKGQSGYQQTLNKVIDQLTKMGAEDEESDGLMAPTRKRITMVAKKSPHIIHKRSEKMDDVNPYFAGTRMDIAAKKNHELAQSSMRDLLAKWLKEHGERK